MYNHAQAFSRHVVYTQYEKTWGVEPGNEAICTHHVASLEYPEEIKVAVALVERPRVKGALGIDGPLRGVHEVAEAGPGEVVHPVEGSWRENARSV